MIERINQLEKVFVERKLLKLFKDAPVDATLDLKKFLEKLILDWNINYDTYRQNSKIFSKNYKTDNANQHRSLQDIFRITKYYKPEVTLYDVTKTLFELREEKKIWSLWCFNIKKITFFKPGSRNYGDGFFVQNNRKIDPISDIELSELLAHFNVTMYIR